MAKFTFSSTGDRTFEVSDTAVVLVAAAFGAVVVGVAAAVTRSPEVARAFGDAATSFGQLTGGGRKLLR